MTLELRAVCPQLEQPLADFFTAIRSSDELHFHPHPFTAAYARHLVQHCGRDLYYLLVDGKCALAYGMLRGWDEGYETPSLGIAVHPEARRGRLGELMMHFLHCAARRRGAQCVRLRVYDANVAAKSLYTKLGYRFDSMENGELVGILEL